MSSIFILIFMKSSIEFTTKCEWYIVAANIWDVIFTCKYIIKYLVLLCLVVQSRGKLVTVYADSSHGQASKIIGLQKCAYIYLAPNTTLGKYQWQIATFTGSSQTSTIFSVDVAAFSGYIGSWSNNVDQLIFAAYDNVTGQKYVQMIDLQANTSSKFTHALQFDFAVYSSKTTVLMIDAQYPYRIWRGSVKQNSFQQIFQYPPTKFTPLHNLECSYDNECVWVMREGMVFNYPMAPIPRAVSIKDDKILQTLLVKINETDFMYTGTIKGLIYEWQGMGLQQYRVKRILSNLAGSPIKAMFMVSNSTLVAMNTQNVVTYICMNTSLQTDTFRYGQLDVNLAATCNFYPGTNPLISHYGLTSASSASWVWGGLQQYTTQVGNISATNYTTFQDVTCQITNERVEHSVGEYANHKIFQCYFHDQAFNNADLNNLSSVPGCLKYFPRYQPVCYQCDAGYFLKPTSIPTSNAQFNFTVCASKLGSNAYDLDAFEISDRGKQVLAVFNSIMLAAQGPFFYIKNILQLTLFSFIVHNFLSFWILTSLYYFLATQPNFIKYILLNMWKTYNYSTFALFGIQLPKLPRLNNQQSNLDYGDVVISNDFLQFTFDPAMMLAIMFTNYLIFYYLRKWLKKKFLAKTKLKLSWLKFDLFESLSDVIIQILPILFLPCTNFLFNPNFSNSSQKMNFVLFSALGGFALIFPFLYFSKLVKDKRYDEVVSNSETGSIEKDTKQINPKTKQIRKTLNKFEQIQSFLVTKGTYVDSFFDSVLCLTIPILVTLDSKVPFFCINSVIITSAMVNTLFLKKGRLNTFLYRFYMFLFHVCFVVMEIAKEGEVFNNSGILAIGVMIICMIHQILQFIYKMVKFIQNLIKDWKRRNIIDNKYILKKAAKKAALQHIKNQTFKQFMQTKQLKRYFEEQKLKKMGVSKEKQQSLSFKNPNRAQQVEGSHFFNQNTKIEDEQILPFTPAIPSIAESKIDRRKPRLKRQKLKKKQSILSVVQNLNKQNSLKEDEINSQKQLSQDSRPMKLIKRQLIKDIKWR